MPSVTPALRAGLARRAVCFGAAALALFAPLVGHADSTAKFMVPFPAGGAADAMARVLVDKLKDELKQNIVVDNRPGGSTRIAAEILKQAPADGNTVLMTLLDTMVIAPMVYSNMRYDPLKDFAPITEVAGVTYGIAVPASAPYTNLKEFLTAAKGDAGKSSVGISGLGSTLHFLAFDFTKKIGGDMTIVPFQGGPAMVTNLLGNQIGAAMDGLGVFVEQHKAKKLRVLAVSGSVRASQLPEVPTFVESGMPSLVIGSSYALYAPAGTPEAQIQRWNQAMRKVLAMPEVQARLQGIGYEPTRGSSPDDVSKLRKKLFDHWQPIVAATGFKGD